MNILPCKNALKNMSDRCCLNTTPKEESKKYIKQAIWKLGWMLTWPKSTELLRKETCYGVPRNISDKKGGRAGKQGFLYKLSIVIFW